VVEVLMKLTLDTNCLINLFDSTSSSRTSVDALHELVRAAMANEVSLAITTRVERDVANDRDEGRRAEMLERLAMFPVIGSVLRAGLSSIGTDFAAGSSTQAVEAEVRGILAPGISASSKRVGNAINDVDHVVGHVMNERDVFVTDDRGILRNAEALKRSVGAVVMSPQECVDYLARRQTTRASADQPPVAEQAIPLALPAIERPGIVAGEPSFGDLDQALAAIVEDLKDSDLQRAAQAQATCDGVLGTIRHIIGREIVQHLSNAFVLVQSNYHPISGGSHSEIGIARRDKPEVAFMRALDVAVAGRELTIMIDGEVIARLDAETPILDGEAGKNIRANYLSGLQKLGQWD
jgi:hypothetical protein